jgi:hypothetical protein
MARAKGSTNAPCRYRKEPRLRLGPARIGCETASRYTGFRRVRGQRAGRYVSIIVSVSPKFVLVLPLRSMGQ